MKASLQAIRQLNATDIDVLSTGLPKLTALATNRLGGLESVTDYGARFDGVVVAHIVTCVKHENSDHLQVCMIDDGGAVKDVERDARGHVQVVCGAPNAREGITVAWIPPGTTVPSSLEEAEAFTLSIREIRGKISNGMLASPNELGIYDDSEGILEIQVSEVGLENIKPGAPFKNLYGLDDVLIDFENKMFTHRPDCFGQIGLGRELAGIQGIQFSSPEWYLNAKNPIVTGSIKMVGKNEIPDKVTRFMLQAVEGITVKDSPVWMKAYLHRVGIKPINSIVDWSNYYMHITAQPTHAFDYDKVKALSSGEVTIYPRMAKKGETLKLLNGKEVKLTEEDMVIANDSQPIALAGIMGGSETEVDENTKTIVIECATFDMYAVRKASMRHGLFTDAVTRYTKGQSALQNDKVLAKIVSDICEYEGAIAGQIYDSIQEASVKSSITIGADFVNSRLGTSLTSNEIAKSLKNVEIECDEANDVLTVHVPFWRTDLSLKEDVVEEVGRLYGFDRLDLKLPLRSTKPARRNALLDYKTLLRNQLSRSGANEVLGYSFVHGDLLKKTGIEDVDKWAFHIRNALSPDLQYYRTSLLPSLLLRVRSNLKSDLVRSDDNEFALFEIGKAHVKGHNDDEGLPIEYERLALVFAADDKTAKRKYAGAPYYQAKHYLSSVVGSSVELKPLESNDYPICAPYQIGRSAMVYVNGQLLGVVGEFRASVKRDLKLPEFCAGFELDVSLLMDQSKTQNYRQISNYPKTQQDITFRVSSSTTFETVESLISGELERKREENGYESTIMARDIFQKDGETTKNLTYRIWLWHPDKTLKTVEANSLLDVIADKANTELSAVRI